MPSFASTINPTPFGFFDPDTSFQTEADSMVTFVKRKMGDDILSVELTNRQIWACFEEACCEYSHQIHQVKIKSELMNMLGVPTGSTDLTNKLPKQSLEYLMRQAEPYASYANVMGSYDPILGYIDLKAGVQDYNLYDSLKNVVSGTLVYGNGPGGVGNSKLRLIEIFQLEPLAAQQFLLNASNVTNFLATNFNYESYVNSTIFYVLPVFEDVLRRGMLETAFRVRRSHYSYDIIGRQLRIYPIPVTEFQLGKLFIKVAPPQNPLDPSYEDDSIYGISGPQNMPLNNIPYVSITQPGRQWIRQYTLALARELLGLVRSKFQNIPIPNADLQLNGADLVSQGRDDKEKLITQLREFLDNLTNAKLLETAATAADNMIKQLRHVPVPNGRAIIIG
jgi:hypothetical protein